LEKDISVRLWDQYCLPGIAVNFKKVCWCQ